MSKILTFQDQSFRLAVLNILMYDKNLFEPAIDAFEFARNYDKRIIDIDEEGFEIIPEILEYFNKLEILDSHVKDIDEIYQDGGDEIYMAICPFWSGEDDSFNIRSAEDASLLPKLKEVTLFHSSDSSILEQFQSRGIRADWL